ncbi:M81 family metallopeptidase [Massilia sp. SR12]
MKIFVSGLATETNTFSDFPTTLASFEELGIARGPVAAGDLNICGPVAEHWRQLARLHGDEMSEGLYAVAQPAGPVQASAYVALRDELLTALAAAGPVHMVLLILHGAMVAEGIDDCEGDLLRHVRAHVGPDCIVGAILDPHCHLSAAMTKHANALILMREYPHTDFIARAAELYALCRQAALGQVRPVMAVVDCHMVGFYPTTEQPMRAIVDALSTAEQEPGILSASIVHGFPWADVEEAGTKVLVIADGAPDRAAAVAHQLASSMYRARYALLPELESVDEILLAPLEGPLPIIVADAGDNPGGGAPCDHTGLLAALLARPALPSAFGMLWDPAAVARCRVAGVGARVMLRVGGKAGPSSGSPLNLDVLVCGLTDHHTQNVGSLVDPLGAAAWVRCGATDIVLISRRQQTLSPTAFTNLGVPLHEAAVIGVKSSHHYYAEFSCLSSHCRIVETGAALSMDFAHLPYRRRGRHYFPAVDNPAPELA